MIVYNITCILDTEKHIDFLSHLEDELLPILLEDARVKSFQMLEMLDSPNEGITLSLQFIFDNRDEMEAARHAIGNAFQQLMKEQFNGSLFIFDSVMKKIR